MYPSDAQYAAIKARDSLETVEAAQQVAIRDGSLTLDMSLPVHGISLVVISAPNA